MSESDAAVAGTDQLATAKNLLAEMGGEDGGAAGGDDDRI